MNGMVGLCSKRYGFFRSMQYFSYLGQFCDVFGSIMSDHEHPTIKHNAPSFETRTLHHQNLKEDIRSIAECWQYGPEVVTGSLPLDLPPKFLPHSTCNA
jgi:hypothetical protein